nr:PREDICTED: formin-like protein 3 [Bos mutus]
MHGARPGLRGASAPKPPRLPSHVVPADPAAAAPPGCPRPRCHCRSHPGNQNPGEPAAEPPPRSPSWRKQRPAGSCKPPPSLWLSSCGMRWLPPRCSPEAQEAGLWLCEKHPGLRGAPGASPTPVNTPKTHF